MRCLTVCVLLAVVSVPVRAAESAYHLRFSFQLADQSAPKVVEAVIPLGTSRSYQVTPTNVIDLVAETASRTSVTVSNRSTGKTLLTHSLGGEKDKRNTYAYVFCKPSGEGFAKISVAGDLTEAMACAQ